MGSPAARARLRTSATGAIDLAVTIAAAVNRSFSRPLRSYGFSLIELLVVILIVGIVAGAVALSVRGSGEREVENAARRAQALVRLACERAALTGRDIGFALAQDGLRFGYFEQEGWQPLPDSNGSEELRPRPLGRELTLRAERDGETLLPMSDAGRKPSFACLSSGELTPFVLHIERADAETAWALEGRLDGSLELAGVRRGR